MRAQSLSSRRGIASSLLLLCTLLLGPAMSYAALGQSSHDSLPADVLVSSTNTLLSKTFTLSSTEWVYVQSDGRYFPASGRAANISILIDGQNASNDAFIDWSASTNAQQHSFNVIGARQLGAGTHTVQLVAHLINGSYYVGSGSNLSILVRPASTVVESSLGADQGPFNFTTGNLVTGQPTPSSTLLSTTLNPSNQAIIALASGRAYKYADYGDAMFGLYLNGANQGNDESLWSVNDIWTGAETQAPLYTHAYFQPRSGSATISLGATEFPWEGREDSVNYKVGAGTRLVTLMGGMTVSGSSALSTSVDNWVDWLCIGTDEGWPGCPPVDTDVLLTEATINIPSGHNGVVLFLAKSRVQGDSTDGGGTVSLWLTIDGQRFSSTGVQQLAYPDVVSQRTITASVMTAGSRALSPGPHTVRVYGRASGSFIHLAMVKDLPLIWFD